MRRGKLFGEYFVAGDPKGLFFALKSKNVPFSDLKKQKNGVLITVDLKDRKKFFAISRNMCYNISVVRYKGRYAPFKYAAANIGLVLGFAAFTVLAFLSDGAISEITYTDSVIDRH